MLSSFVSRLSIFCRNDIIGLGHARKMTIHVEQGNQRTLKSSMYRKNFLNVCFKLIKNIFNFR